MAMAAQPEIAAAAESMASAVSGAISWRSSAASG